MKLTDHENARVAKFMGKTSSMEASKFGAVKDYSISEIEAGVKEEIVKMHTKF